MKAYLVSVVEGEDDGKFLKLNVGSGLTDENREQIWATQDAVIGQLVEIRAPCGNTKRRRRHKES